MTIRCFSVVFARAVFSTVKPNIRPHCYATLPGEFRKLMFHSEFKVFRLRYAREIITQEPPFVLDLRLRKGLAGKSQIIAKPSFLKSFVFKLFSKFRYKVVPVRRKYSNSKSSVFETN